MFECRVERKKNVLGENRKMGGGDGNRRFQSVKCRVPQGWDTMKGGKMYKYSFYSSYEYVVVVKEKYI